MFIGDFPAFFITDFVHWLAVLPGPSHHGDLIEFRPLCSPWTSSAVGWHLYVSHLAHSTMCCVSSPWPVWLLDIRSAAVASIYSYLNALDDLKYLTITSSNSSEVTVELPRYKLSFFINDRGQLESKNMRNMIVDPNQYIGTMFGLSRRLVLKREMFNDNNLSRRARAVIIPKGDVQFDFSGDHSYVEIDIGSGRQVQYLKYEVDTDLGYLAGSGTLVSTLYKVYLHAVTSHCLLDPLTSRTGTEEALRELASATCMSFRTLGVDEIDLLTKIHALTPKREYYPPHIQAMQTVKWAVLAPSAQHFSFSILSQSIIHYSEALRIFYPEQSPLPDEFTNNPSNGHLCRRAALHQRLVYPHAQAGVLLSNKDDRPYDSRDLVEGDAEAAVAATSALVNSWPSLLSTSSDIFEIFLTWGHIRGPSKASRLSYNRQVLDSQLAHLWLTLYDLSRKSSDSSEIRLAMAFTLPTLSYTLPNDRHLLPTILAFASSSEFHLLEPPPHASYNLTYGFEPKREELTKLAINHALPLYRTPSADLMRSYGETPSQFDRRKEAHYENARDAGASTLVDEVLHQWPCAKPDMPIRHDTVIDVSRWMDDVRHRFRECYNNVELREFMRIVQNKLDTIHRSSTLPLPPYAFSSAAASSPSGNSSIEIAELLQREPPTIRSSLGSINTSGPYSKGLKADTPKLWSLFSGFGSSIRISELLPPFLRSRSSSRSSSPSSLHSKGRKVNTQMLGSLLTEFRFSTSTVERLYGMELEESRATLETQYTPVYPECSPFSQQALIQNRQDCYDSVQNMFASIRSSLYPETSVEKAVFVAGQWPRISVRTLLEVLAGNSVTEVTSSWKNVLILFAQEIIRYQRSQRMLAHAEGRRFEELYKELDNDESGILDVTQHPEWLLIQVRALSSVIVKSLDR